MNLNIERNSSFTIGEVAESLGMATSAIRYYESEGLLPPVKRNDSGRRAFNSDDIDWIDNIRCFKEAGMPVKEIKHIVDLTLEGDETIQERIEILENHRQRILQKIQKMNGFLLKVDKKIQWYKGQ